MISLKSRNRAAESLGRALLVGLLIIVPSCELHSPPPPLATPLVIRVVGRDFYWLFTYPGRDGTIGTDDDVTSRQVLHLPLDHPVRLELTSEDYAYAFRVPELKLLESAIPGLLFTIDFVPRETGSYELEVDPMCGFSFAHDNDVMGQLLIEPAAEVQTWLAEARK